MKLDRRTLLIGGGAGLGLVVALAAWPRQIGSGLHPRDEDRVFDHYLKVGSDGRVTVAVPQVETGQGIWTALPQVVADELGAAWETMAVEPAPSSPLYANPLAEDEGWLSGLNSWRRYRLSSDGALRITAGSTSVRAFEEPLRRSAAAARALLCAAAAERWDVAAAECDTEGGFVVHEGKRLGFGALAGEAAAMTPPEEPALRPPGSGRLAGQPLPRLDLPGKTDGSARLAADVRLPRLLFASVRMAPIGGTLTGYDDSGADRSVRLVADDRWLAAVGPSWWAAEQALSKAAPRFDGSSEADSETIERAITQAIERGEAQRLFERGDYQAAVDGSRPLAATYSIAPRLHLGLEALTATARLTGDRLEVWAASQAPEIARRAAAEAASASLEQTTFYPMPVGAADGRAVEADALPIAAALARRLGRPVQVTFSRGQSRRHDRPGSPVMARLKALPTPNGALAAWSTRVATDGGLSQAFVRLLDAGPGKLDLPAAVPPYAMPAVLIEGVTAELPIPTGYLRGGEAAAMAFFTESFIDELARIARIEPLAYRMGMLGGNLRPARAISTAAAIGGWDGGGAGSTMGLACVSAYGSHIGLLASATIAADQSIQVDRLVAAVDCGAVVNPSLVRQQIEGGLIEGLAQATAAPPSFRYGLAVETPLRLPRLARTPVIEVELIPSTEAAGGVSGLGHAAVAPAVANAIAAATGKRLRRLPFDPMSA